MTYKAKPKEDCSPRLAAAGAAWPRSWNPGDVLEIPSYSIDELGPTSHVVERHNA